MWRFMLIFALLPAFAQAGDYSEPKRGSATRTALMEAIRPHAEWNLSPPVQFVVDDLRLSGDLAYAVLNPQRPGGGKIDLKSTPWAQKYGYDPAMDHSYMHVLYRKSGGTWVAVHWSIGATDVWFSAPDLCRVWYDVIPEFCEK